MQIHDLVKTLDQMSDDELLAHIRAIRHRREVIRPAAKARVERVEKKTSRARVGKTADLLANLSEADRAELIKMLSNEEQQE